jgi:hypothetical protein
MDVWGYNDLAQGADYSLTESAFSPFQAEPTHRLLTNQGRKPFYARGDTLQFFTQSVSPVKNIKTPIFQFVQHSFVIGARHSKIEYINYD